MVEELYPSKLREYSLSFNEVIYAIAFELENDFAIFGKEEVFAMLGLTSTQMEKNVQTVLEEMSQDEVYALYRVFGNRNSAFDEELLSRGTSLENEFKNVCQKLEDPSRRYALLGGGDLWKTSDSKEQFTLRADMAKVTGSARLASLERVIGQLEKDARSYTEKLERIMAMLQTIKSEIEGDQTALLSVDSNATSREVANVVSSDSVICWPYRSANLLQELGLKSNDEIVEFFSDFRNFRNSNSVTLLEWLVITTILREAKLLNATGMKVNRKTQTADLDLTARAYNCLCRSALSYHYGVQDIDDLMALFADGGKYGLNQIYRVRNCGSKTFEEIQGVIANLNVEIEYEICYPTSSSPVEALDFNCRERIKLDTYNIRTIADLLRACQDDRFRGLKNIDDCLYSSAVARLKRYGFSS